MRWVRRWIGVALIAAVLVGGWSLKVGNAEHRRRRLPVRRDPARALGGAARAPSGPASRSRARAGSGPGCARGMIVRRYRKAVGGLEAEVHQLRNLPLATGGELRADGRAAAWRRSGRLIACSAGCAGADRRPRATRRPPRARRCSRCSTATTSAPSSCSSRARSSTRAASSPTSRSRASTGCAARSAARSDCTRTCCCAATSTATSAIACLADLAADFRQGGFLQRAIASYEEVLERDPKHVPALRALVRAARRRARPPARDRDAAPAGADRAARWPRPRARSSGSTWPRPRRPRVARATRAARCSRALRARRALACARGSCSGQLEAERGRSKAALAAWQRVPGIDRKSGALVYPRIESAYAALDRSREFETYLRELLAERGDDLHVRLALARALAARGEIEEALAELRRVLERDPEHLAARAALGRLLLSEHRDPEAHQGVRRAARRARALRPAARAGAARMSDERGLA